MEAIEQGHGGPEVVFANRNNDAAERTEWRMPLAATAPFNRHSVRQARAHM
jgi:hypothetical protein